MKRLALLSIVLVMSCPAGMSYADAPTMEAVVRAPRDYAGATVEFTGARLSGKITTYDVSGVRKYYLTLGSRRKTFEAGFFLAPPALADKLYETMDPDTNYPVKIACRVERIVINRVPQWHGIVTRVDFLDADGRVTETVQVGKK